MEWKREKLGDICFTTSGGTPSRKNPSYYENGTIPWVKSGELENNIIMSTEEKITVDAINNSSAKVFPKGTLLIALYGATIGKLAFLGIDAATNQAVCGLFENKKVELSYLYYFLMLQRPNLVKQGIGGAQPNISQTILKKLVVSYPADKEEQLRIVANIEELFSKLDKAEETLYTTKSQLEVYRQAVLKKAFDGEYTPEIEMKDITMDELADGKDGLRRGPFGSAIKKAFFVESGYKVYEQGNAINDDSQRGTYFISQEKYDELSGFHVGAGDFIVSCSGTIGRIAQLPESAVPGVINQALMRIRLKKDIIDTRFFLLQFRSEVFQRRIISRGSGMANLAGVKEFRLATMKMPVIYEHQMRIIEEAESRLSVCDSIEATVEAAIIQGKALRQSILKEAFEGGVYYAK